MSASASASAAVIKGLKGKRPDFRAVVYILLICFGVIGIILLINWYAGNI